MLKKIISIVPVAMLSATLGANAQAATITVQKGDTLWDLSRAHNTSVENIQTLNHINTNLIHPGDVLTIAQQKQYTVKQGDTLWDIALDHQVTVSQIKEWNQLHTDLIHPGLQLSIFVGMKSSTAVTEKPTMPATHEAKEPATSVDNTPEASTPSTNNTTSTESKPEATVPSTSNTASTESKPEATVPSTSNTTSTESKPEANAPSTSNTAKEIIVEASAYTASCEGCSGITATGINLKANPNAKVISVDPTVIPLGSKVYVEGYGEAIAGDTGGAIKGNRIDVFFPSQQDAINFGVKQLKVTILN
ncbi:LysM peptidoglycan-binding domain-containing protein [Lysinibacillus sp. CD3-6]|uniref:LysM peptidoglycan-binding and 3D domain-containing protein n=1 Tax=Lysinibacillus sp. CD3-6 TaxID=2892541 RepID=UPI001168FD79|nr:3D domain-containing protein [Lysinibacillus sp. CD3-6]UED80322.1 LysM peptidoglycan-binding domain-containing protein [Lysinibacillus sp. CD3-6]